jgi:hypothetical protein
MTGLAAMALFDPPKRAVLNLQQNADGYPVPDDRMREIMRAQIRLHLVHDRPADSLRITPEQAEEILEVVLRAAPRLETNEESLVREGLDWLELLGTPTRGVLTERGRHQERMAAAVSRFIRLALGDPPRKLTP